MPKLSDTQLIFLSAACSREDRRVLPLPKSLKGGAATKVIGVLLAKGLIAEIDANVLSGVPVWRDDGEGSRVTLVATEAADAVLDGGSIEAAPNDTQRPNRPKKAGKVTKAPPKAKAAKAAADPTKGKPRQNSKQAQLISMLKRAKGVSIAEVVEALGWQAHTVRGAMAGALKKRLGLAIESEKHESRGRVYRIAE